jgi:uncharacterized caspase-like protein
MTWADALRTALLALVALMAGQIDAHAEKRVALVVGNSSYEHAVQLPNPANDGAAVGRLLKAAGFDTVEVKRDLGAVAFKRALREFTLTARDADMAVIFFAGHGIEVGGVNYLVPVDAKLASDIDAEDEGVSLDRVLRAMEPARRLRLVILDACRDNPFLRIMRRTITTRAVTSGLAQVEPMTTDTLIAFAAKAGSTAEDGGGPNSPFTTALLKHLAEPGLDLQLAFRKVRDDVLRATRWKQEPYVYGSLGGDTISLVPPLPVIASPPEPRPDELTWEILKGSSDIDAIRRFTEQFPASSLRKSAEERILVLSALEKQRRDQAEREERERERVAKEAAERAAKEAERIAREEVVKRQAELRAREEAAKQEAEPRAREAAGSGQADRGRSDGKAANDLPDQPPPSGTEAARKERPDAKAPDGTNAPAQSAEQAPGPRMAALPPGTTAAPAEAAPPTGGVLVRQIKQELLRIGCYSGPVDDRWPTAQATSALKKFAHHARVAPPGDGLTNDTLDALRRSPARLCPLQCSPREVEKDGRCVAKTCAAGQRLGADGSCTPVNAGRSNSNRSATPSPGRKCFVFGGRNYCE